MDNKLNELFKELAAKIASGEITTDRAKARLIEAGANKDDAEEIFGPAPENPFLIR